MTVAFEHDAFADKRLGIDVFESLLLPASQKRHVMINTDAHGIPPLVAEHNAPTAAAGQADAIDFLLWRYADLLETCALTGHAATPTSSIVGTWSDGTPTVRALVSPHPVDSGPMPAILAECDALFGTGGRRPRSTSTPVGCVAAPRTSEQWEQPRETSEAARTGRRSRREVGTWRVGSRARWW